jgi:hypothetical protein
MLLLVSLRRDGRFFARPPAHEPLNGKVYRFRSGFQLRDEARCQFAGEVAMVPDRADPERPYPVDGPDWMPSGDLVPPNGEATGDLVEMAK